MNEIGDTDYLKDILQPLKRIAAVTLRAMEAEIIKNGIDTGEKQELHCWAPMDVSAMADVAVAILELEIAVQKQAEKEEKGFE